MNSESLFETAYLAIRTKILSLEFEPGTLLSNYKLAKELEMSRTPISQAIARLEMEELVVTFKNRGVMVREISTRECLDIFELMHCHRLYTLELVKNNVEYEYPIDLLEELLKELFTNSEQKQYVNYVDSSLKFMRALIIAPNNQVMLQIFDAQRDKLLLSSLTSYKLNPHLRYYSGVQFSTSLFHAIKQRKYEEAKEILVTHYHKVRERILKSGIVKM